MALSMISNLRMHPVSVAFGFLSAAQPNVTDLKHWIVSGRYQWARIEHLADLRATIRALADDCSGAIPIWPNCFESNGWSS
jgi:hypothetical protein